MQIRTVAATITIGERTRALTKSIAQQLPVLLGADAFDMLRVCTPLGKVQGKTLGFARHTWLFLVEDNALGYHWVDWCTCTELADSAPLLIL